ncbi:MAG TPA: class I SAM-dependent methyltransferase [Bryobacteraceae bacterium]|nr:class I SAM-dependent methyltransferase [Bryobacteraceae bacterium]
MSAEDLCGNRPVSCPPAAYDCYTKTFVSAYDTLMIRRLAQECRHVERRLELLDIGTGTARLLLQIAATGQFTSAALIGLEYFSDMAGQAWSNVLNSGLRQRIQIVQGDAHALPFDDNSFDIVVSRSTIHHFADPVRAIRETYRVLRSEGVAIIHEVRRDAPAVVVHRFNTSRAAAGIGNSTKADKYTVQQLQEFVSYAGIADESTLRIASAGYASLGMELRIKKK